MQTLADQYSKSNAYKDPQRACLARYEYELKQPVMFIHQVTPG